MVISILNMLEWSNKCGITYKIITSGLEPVRPYYISIIYSVKNITNNNPINCHALERIMI
jgi:hypothetical protein